MNNSFTPTESPINEDALTFKMEHILKIEPQYPPTSEMVSKRQKICNFFLALHPNLPVYSFCLEQAQKNLHESGIRFLLLTKSADSVCSLPTEVAKHILELMFSRKYFSNLNILKCVLGKLANKGKEISS